MRKFSMWNSCGKIELGKYVLSSAKLSSIFKLTFTEHKMSVETQKDTEEGKAEEVKKRNRRLMDACFI